MSANLAYAFQGLSGYFFDYADQQKNQSKLIPATTLPSLGLIEREYSDGKSSDTSSRASQKSWQRLATFLEELNAEDENARYKVLYITRHGYGYHNAAMAKFGNERWNNHWSHLDGDGEVTWADAHLNEQGIEQGKALSQFWTDAIENDGIPLPDSIYTSPLARALETTRLAFAPVMQHHARPFRPIVKEALRERLTAHTCDRRSSRAWITENYPECIIEPGFTMEDELWRSDWVETAAEHRARAHGFLEELFEGDEGTFVALTVHSYAVSAVLEAVGMPGFRVSEGSVVAVLLRGERVSGGSRTGGF